MLEQVTAVKPVKGKTYSLFGTTTNTIHYYNQIEKLLDACLQRCPDMYELLAHVQQISGKKRFLKQQLKMSADRSLSSFIVTASRNTLLTYTEAVKTHLKNPSLRMLGDGTLLTTEEQYHLYMLEIALVNRIFKERFNRCDVKVAFLPHCLHDLDKKCRAASDGIDYVCKGCSKKCFINRVSTLLRAHDIRPYIWMDANLKSLFKDLQAQGTTVGVLGIACIPELVDGIRLCTRLNIPVVGVPLNANRCARWMGKFHETSVDIEALERLVDGH
ncbi:MAG: DUF116 domain-containing protein [Candidatus Aquicultor sp.]